MNNEGNKMIGNKTIIVIYIIESNTQEFMIERWLTIARETDDNHMKQ